MNAITYRVGNDIPIDIVKTLYEASTLGQRRPIDDPGTLDAMMPPSAPIIATRLLTRMPVCHRNWRDIFSSITSKR